MEVRLECSSLLAPRSSLLAFCCVIGLVLAALGRAQTPIEQLTHDWTSTTTPNTLSESGTDAKSPGDGFTYAVSTIDVETTNPAVARYSLQGVSLPSLPNPPNPPTLLVPVFNPPGQKQVVLLQKTNANTGAIVNQAFFYGITPSDPEDIRATNARGLSVYPAATAEDTRLSICGETYEDDLPLSRTPGGWSQASAQHPSGFVAVYDGNLQLLWTVQFFGQSSDSQAHDCAITDVSIRAEGTAPNQVDVVTYCGLSSFGLATGPLAPVNAYVLGPYFPEMCGNTVHGALQNGPGQWDGLVGRVSRAHGGGPGGGPAVAPEFHSIVGGFAQDAMFGIAEMEDQRFTVAATTARTASTQLGTSTVPFPFTGPFGTCLNGVSEYCVGAVLTFDAAPTRITPTPQPLILETSAQIGTAGTGIHTVARDVLVQFAFDPTMTPRQHMIYVVGSTDDTIFQRLGVAPAPQAAPVGVDGFVLGGNSTATIGITSFLNGTFHDGGSGLRDGFTGIAAWNEFPDHPVCGGFTEVAANNFDFDVTGLFVDSTNPVGGSLVGPLQLLQTTSFGGPGTETPAAMGNIHALRPNSGLFYDDCNLGSPTGEAGGGVCVDERGRLNIIGATTTTNIPPLGTGSRAFLGGQDAIRTVFSMLPPRVSRSDGTGTRGQGLTPAPMPAPYDGGTLPVCGLQGRLPFGYLIGGPVPPLKRMMIDYQGPNPAQYVTASLLLDRPPPQFSIVAAVWQIGFPLSPPDVLTVPGLELWWTGSVALYAWQAPPPGSPWMGSCRFPIASMIAPSPITFTVQGFLVLSTPLCGGTMINASTPALSIDY